MALHATLVAKPFAHRGLHNAKNGVIENSPTAFRRAIDGDYAIECDLQLSADGVAMVIHDDTTDRVTGQSGTVFAMTGAAIAALPLKGSNTGDTSLSFSALLDLVDGKVPLAIELKPQTDGRDAELVEVALAGVKKYEGPYTFISFSPTILSLLRRKGFAGTTGIIVERFVSEVAQDHLNWFQRFSMRHMLHYPFTRFDFIDCDHTALDLPAVRLFRALGFPLAVWTIRSQADADRALTQADQIAFEGFIPRRD